CKHGVPLQSDVIPQRIGMAARQCFDRARACALRLAQRRATPLQGLVRCGSLYGAAPIAGTVLRLPARPRPRANALSRCVLAPGLGERDTVYPDRSLAGAAVSSQCKRDPFTQPLPAVLSGR